tara:strand:- start:16643 stop:17440 length:798 start_codon:yes stop_codon:yes gene_type:complete
MTQKENRRPRILVGASSFADAATALRLVDKLATIFRSVCGGVLVEEESILAICQIQDKRIILMNGATMKAPSRSQVRTQLNADARAFRQSLARTAKAAGADWAFSQEAGDLINIALRAATGWDILVIGSRYLNAIKGKIVLLEMLDAVGEEMRDAAELLARQFSADQVVFSVDQGKRREGSTLSSANFSFASLDEALRALAQTNAQAVLVDYSRGPVRTAEDISRLLEVSHSPVIIFGISGANVAAGNTVPSPYASDARGQIREN